jgi:hypothetical protein
MKYALIISTLLLSGCFLWRSPAPEAPAEVTTKAGKVDAYADKNDLIMSRAASSVIVARSALDQGLTSVASAELDLAQTYLPRPSETDLAYAQARALKADPKAYAKSKAVADAHQRQLDDLWSKVEAEKQKAKDQLEAKEKELESARKEKQTTLLSLVGAGLITLGTLGLLFGLNRINAVVVIAIGAGVAALPWLFDSPAFIWIAGGAAVLGALEVLWLIYKKLKPSQCVVTPPSDGQAS